MPAPGQSGAWGQQEEADPAPRSVCLHPEGRGWTNFLESMEVEQGRETVLDWEEASPKLHLDTQLLALQQPELGGRSGGKGGHCPWPVWLVG